MNTHKTAENYINTTPIWAAEKLLVLRKLALASGLTETVKWGAPCYVGKKNVMGLAAFKGWVSLWFYQGSFLKGSQKKLLSAQEKTRGLRQWRFLPEDELDENLILAYIKEAVENDKNEVKIEPEIKTTTIPVLLFNALADDENLKTEFDKLTPGKQREYCEYITEAKREATQINRLKKIIPMVKNGVGLNDKYKR